MARLLSKIPEIIGMKQIEDPTVTLNPGYCQLISNYYKNDGVWFQRTGATKVLGSATGQAITGIKEVLWDDASKSMIVASGDKWYTDSGTGCVTLTSIKSGLLNNQKINVKQFKISNVSNAVIASKALQVQKYNKTTLSDLTSSFSLDFSSVEDTTLSGLDNAIVSSIIDSTKTYLYVLRTANPGLVTKIKIEDMTIVGSATLPTGTFILSALAIDSTDTYLYISRSASSGGLINIVRLTLADFSTTSVKTLAAGEVYANALAIDSTDTYLYIACGVGANKIVRLTLADFTTTSTKSIAILPTKLIIDSTDTYLYIGDGAIPADIVRLTLADFTTTSTKTLAAGENIVNGLAIDSTDTFLYIGCGVNPGKVVKLTLADFSTTSTKTLATGEGMVYAGGLAIDSTNTYLYIACYILSSPNKIVRLTLSDFTTTSTKTLNTGEEGFQSYFIMSDMFLFFALSVNPNKMFRLSLKLIPQFAETHHSKMWLGGFDNDVYRFMEYFSKTGDATDYVTAADAGTLTFATELSILDTFMGVKSWGDYIIFWFKNNILIYYAGTNPNDFKLVKHIHDVGSLSDSVLSFGADIWFPTFSGIRSLQNAFTSGDIVFNNKSQDVDPVWSTKITAYPTNTDRISIKYDKIRNQIMVLANDSANQGICFYIYSVGDKVWSTYNILGLGASVSVTCFEITQDGLIYFGTSDGNIYQLFSGTTDNGTVISYVIRPTTLYFGNSTSFKKVKYIRLCVDMAVTNGSITYDIDQKGIPRSTAAVVIPSSGTKGLLYSNLIPVSNRGRSWDFQFTNCGLLRQVLFYGSTDGDK